LIDELLQCLALGFDGLQQRRVHAGKRFAEQLTHIHRR
jgi:hypothetical protein